MLTLLTVTGCRPAAWALCQRWMARQTYGGPVRWVIVDDGAQAQDVTFERAGWVLTVLRPQPYWRPGENTQHRNMLAGLEVIDTDAPVAFIEDDDWYRADWLQRLADELQTADVVGQGWNRYYNVRSGEVLENRNERHASLCATGMKGAEAREVFRAACERGRKLVDMHLWKHTRNRRVFAGQYVIGMKALPGRPGIATGHKNEGRPVIDLKEWIGDDATHYAQFRP